ncbi:MAG: ribulose-phosphate 3-epimerase [Candidatus Omnitrophota bacterium]
MKIKIAPSILSCDFASLSQEIERCNRAKVDMFHIDVMDGHFVPNLTIGPIIIKSIRPYTKLPIEAHLMIENPAYYIKDYIAAGADIITVHAESLGRLKKKSQGFGKFPKEITSFDEKKARWILREIKKQGAGTGIALNPGTPLCIKDILDDLDMVLIMSVNPGFAGQSFKPEVLSKVKALRKIFSKDIAVDGGVSSKTAPLVISAGANMLVTASFLFGAKNLNKTVRLLKNLGN